MMRMTKKGTVTISKYEVSVDNFSFDYEGDTWRDAKRNALEWAKERIEEELRSLKAYE